MITGEIPEPVDYIFQGGAEKIFEQAGLNPSRYQALFKETKEILAREMAFLSRVYGISYERVDLYEQKKKDILYDLLKLKEEGKIGECDE